MPTQPLLKWALWKFCMLQIAAVSGATALFLLLAAKALR